MNVHKKIEISSKSLNKIIMHSETAYPTECCGLLLREINSIGKISDIKIMENKAKLDKHKRYEIDPVAYIRAETELNTKGYEIIGFYHSHPNNPPKPSSIDKANAWPDYLYLITSVYNHKVKEKRIWRYNHNNKEFEEEELNCL